MIELIQELPGSLLHLLNEGHGDDDDSAVTLKFVLADVKLTVDAGELYYEGSDLDETFSRLATDVSCQKGTLYITSEKVIWFNEEKKLGIAFPNQAILLHALLHRPEASTWDLFLQAEAGQVSTPGGVTLQEEDWDPEDAEECCLTWDLTMELGDSKELAEALFAALQASSFAINDNDSNSDDDDNHTY